MPIFPILLKEFQKSVSEFGENEKSNIENN